MADPAPVPGRVSVAIVTYDCAGFVERPLESLREQTWPDVEVVVADNASRDGTPELVRERFPEARLLPMGANLGFAEANNRAVAASGGEVVMLLNPDAWLEPDTLERLVRPLLADPSIGAVGGTVRHEDGAVQEVGNRLDRLGFPVPRRGGAREPVDRGAFFVGGCALMLRRRDWDRVGGLDGRFFMFFEEVDLCWRLQRAGLDTAVVPAASIWHLGGATLAGGYARGGRHRTSPVRVYLRERNTLASVIKNGDPATLAWAGLAWTMNVAEALGFLLMGRRDLAAQYPRALAWNVRHLPESLRLRRAARAASVRRDRDLRGWARGSGKLRVLRAGGIPAVEEGGA